MKPGLRRRLAELACRVLQAALPTRLETWGWAVRFEIAEIPDDTRALLFALDSLCGLVPRAIAFHLFQPFAALAENDALSSGGTIAMGFYDNALGRPRAVGIACAVGAVALGIAYLKLAGAPPRYLAVNTGALLVGLALLAIAGRAMPKALRWPRALPRLGRLTMTMALILLATALLGERAEGAARWFRLGALLIQPSLVLLPVSVVAFARSRNALSTAGMIVAAAALAIQPDRAMAAVLAAGLAVLAVMRPDRFVIPALGAGLAAVAVTLVRADALPAVPYVDQILYSSFSVHALAGVAVLVGSVLLVVPAIVGRFYDLADREAYSVFGVVWLAVILAAALGNYPTPIVGYGGSAIIGYVLSLAMLPKTAQTCDAMEAAVCDETDARLSDQQLCVALAGCP